MHVGLDELSLRLDVTAIAQAVHPHGEHPLHVGAMGVMTGAAHIISKGRMHVGGFLLCGCGRMAGKAQLTLTLHQHLLLCRNMGLVTGQATVFFRHGLMRGCDMLGLIFMAGKTDIIALGLKQFWIS